MAKWRERLYTILLAVTLCCLCATSLVLGASDSPDYAEHSSTLYVLVGVFATAAAWLFYRKLASVEVAVKEVVTALGADKVKCAEQRGKCQTEFTKELSEKVDYTTFNGHIHNGKGRVVR